MAQVGVKEPETREPAVDSKMANGQRWLDNSKHYLSARLVNDLEAGLRRRFDKDFSFKPEERTRLQGIIDNVFNTANGRIVLEYSGITDPVLKECAGWYSPSDNKIHINMSKINSEEDLLKVLTHELFHCISYEGSPNGGFAESRTPFQEGSTEFLTRVVLCQNPEKAAKIGDATYTFETFKIYTLLESGSVKLDAFLGAYLGNSFVNEFAATGNPEDEFKRQLDVIRPGATDELFPALDYYTFHSIALSSLTYASHEMGELAEILNARGANIDDLAKSAKEDFGIRVPAQEEIQTQSERRPVFDGMSAALAASAGGQEEFAPIAGLSLHAYKVQGAQGVTFEIWQENTQGQHEVLGTVDLTNKLNVLAAMSLPAAQLFIYDVSDTEDSTGAKYTITIMQTGMTVTLTKEEMTAILAAAGYTLEQFEQMDDSTKTRIFKEAARKVGELGLIAEER